MLGAPAYLDSSFCGQAWVNDGFSNEECTTTFSTSTEEQRVAIVETKGVFLGMGGFSTKPKRPELNKPCIPMVRCGAAV